jgi:ABC-type glycerol-3-phosphate transport system permease component
MGGSVNQKKHNTYWAFTILFRITIPLVMPMIAVLVLDYERQRYFVRGSLAGAVKE